MSRGGVSEVPQVFCSAWQPVGWDREVHFLHGPRATSQDVSHQQGVMSFAQWCILPCHGGAGFD